MKKIILFTLLLVLFASCASCSQTYVSSHSEKFINFSEETRTKFTTDTNVLNNTDNYCVVIYERINFIPLRKAPSHMFRVKKCDEIIIDTDTIKVKY